MKFCTFLWKKTATQKIFCIAVMQKCIANCDAIPGKLFPVVTLRISIYHIKICWHFLPHLAIFWGVSLVSVEVVVQLFFAVVELYLYPHSISELVNRGSKGKKDDT